MINISNSCKAVIDTSVILAYVNQRDEQHAKALRVFAEQELPFLLLPEVINECLAITRKRVGKAVATKLARELTDTNVFKFYQPPLKQVNQTLQLFEQHNAKYSFTDLVVYLTAKTNNLTIIGIDRHFSQLQKLLA